MSYSEFDKMKENLKLNRGKTYIETETSIELVHKKNRFGLELFKDFSEKINKKMPGYNIYLIRRFNESSDFVFVYFTFSYDVRLCFDLGTIHQHYIDTYLETKSYLSMPGTEFMEYWTRNFQLDSYEIDIMKKIKEETVAFIKEMKPYRLHFMTSSITIS